jgi:hypothetical protein
VAIGKETDSKYKFEVRGTAPIIINLFLFKKCKVFLWKKVSIKNVSFVC